MEEASKKEFKTYSSSRVNSSVTIAPIKNTLMANENFLKAKIQYIDGGHLKSSPQVMKKFCQFRQHDKDICPKCKEDMDKESTTDGRITFNKD